MDCHFEQRSSFGLVGPWVPCSGVLLEAVAAEVPSPASVLGWPWLAFLPGLPACLVGFAAELAVAAVAGWPATVLSFV